VYSQNIGNDFNLCVETFDKKDFSNFANISTPRSLFIGIGESIHGCEDIELFKNELTKFILKGRGYKCLIIESNFASCIPLNRYLNDSSAKLDSFFLRSLLNKTKNWLVHSEPFFDLLVWIKLQNQSKGLKDRIQLYGMDAQFGIWQAIQDGRSIFEKYDSTFLLSLRDLIENKSLINKAKWTALDQAKEKYFKETKVSLLDSLSIINIMESIERFLHNQSFSKYSRREELMFANVKRISELILDKESGAILWAHNGHIAKKWKNYPVLGTFLFKEYASNYKSIGVDIRKATFKAIDTDGKADRNKLKTFQVNNDDYFIDKRFVSNDTSCFYLNLNQRGCNPKIKKVFDIGLSFSQKKFSKSPNWYYSKVKLNDCFDGWFIL
jgi:erythromycin esterase-like protein